MYITDMGIFGINYFLGAETKYKGQISKFEGPI